MSNNLRHILRIISAILLIIAAFLAEQKSTLFWILSVTSYVAWSCTTKLRDWFAAFGATIVIMIIIYTFFIHSGVR